MKLIDVHIHLFPDDVADSYIKNYGEHSNLRAVCRPTLDSLLREYGDTDVLKLIILQEWQSTVPFESDNLKLMAATDKYYFYSFNSWLGKIQRENENVICFGGVHPEEQGRIEEFERMVGEYELSGLKLPQCMQQFYVNDKRMFPIYERAQALNLPVLIHTGMDPIPGMDIFGHPRDAGDVAGNFPELTIIMAHVGTPFFDETREVLNKHENVFADISFFIELEEPAAAASRIRDMGVERFMFGSDFPFVRPKSAIESLLRLEISDDEKELIFWKNATSVLGI